MDNLSIVQACLLIGIYICFETLSLLVQAEKRKYLCEFNENLQAMADFGHEKLCDSLFQDPALLTRSYSGVLKQHELDQLPGYQALHETLKDCALPPKLVAVVVDHGFGPYRATELQFQPNPAHQAAA